MEHTLNYKQNTFRSDIKNASRHFIRQFMLRENIIKAGIMINGCEYERAINTLNEVLRDDPDNTDALNDLTTAYILTGNSIKAMHTIYRVLELNPQDEVANENLLYLRKRNDNANRGYSALQQ